MEFNIVNITQLQPDCLTFPMTCKTPLDLVSRVAFCSAKAAFASYFRKAKGKVSRQTLFRDRA